MDEVEQFSHLIADVYDAALDRSRWPGVLQRTCAYVQGCAASVLSHDLVEQSASFHFSWNDNPAYTQSYVETYAKLNPAIVPATIQSQLGDVSTILDFISYDEWIETRIYKEWSRPQGYVDCVQVVLDKSATSYAAVAVMRDDEQGPTDPEARRRMQLLEPHFRRSVGIGKIITFKTVEAAALAETLDAIKTAILLTDKNQRLVHANTAGESLLADGAAIQRVGDKVAALDAAANQSLQEMLKQATIGDVALARANVSVLLPARDGLSYLAQVLPLTGGARRTTVAGQSAVAAIFVRNARLELPHPLNVIASRYALTPTEMRVLMMIVDVGGTPAVAAALGVSQATVRTHLREIFAKTGLTRQADLVKLVASHMSPTG